MDCRENEGWMAVSKTSRLHKLAASDAALSAQEHGFEATFWTRDGTYKGLPGVLYFLEV